MNHNFQSYLQNLEHYFIEKNNNHFILRNFIFNSITRFKDQLNIQAKGYTKKDLMEDETHFPALLIDFNIYYPNDIEYLSILQLFTNFELTLRSLCESINEHKQNKLKYNDFRGENTLDSFRKYLIYCFDFDIKETIEWQKLEELRLIRNLIAHSNGFFDGKNKKIAQIIDKNVFFSLDKVTNQIMIESEYSLIVTNSLNDAIKEIIKDIKTTLE